ncbi:MAG: hypothetical protein GF309_16565 [Candidatus Lokiarchaeota archaeon]|nr:hypothetical protein [Candidatus Lokiarchaeota archaeon]
MRNRKIFVITLAASMVLLGAIQPQHNVQTLPENTTPVFNADSYVTTGFDSENITIDLMSPANNTEISGVTNITLNITSLAGPLNVTLYTDGEEYPDYNNTPIDTGEQNITVDTTNLAEGNVNFTFLFVNQDLVTPEKESLPLLFLVNNHGPPMIEILAPEENATFTGFDSVIVNITADYDSVFLNVSVDGELVPSYNATSVPVTGGNYTIMINGSEYENGIHQIDVLVYTEEGLTDSASIQLEFLDHVRFAISGLSMFNEISGNQEISIKVFTPYDNVTFSAYVDGELAPDVDNITLPQGRSSFTLNTTPYPEGEANFTFRAYDLFGHKWSSSMILVIDNFGVPEASFKSPTTDIVVGMARFTITIESGWETVNITVYVDDEPVEGLINKTVPTGEYTFQIDTNIYSKWEHDVKVVVTTPEGETTEITEIFGFANLKIEEILSAIGLLAIAILIPLYRKKKGQPLRPVLVVDLIFVLIVLGLFVALGINTIPLLVWHFNLSSIWAVGSALVFTNWVIPLVTGTIESQ